MSCAKQAAHRQSVSVTVKHYCAPAYHWMRAGENVAPSIPAGEPAVGIDELSHDGHKGLILLRRSLLN